MVLSAATGPTLWGCSVLFGLDCILFGLGLCLVCFSDVPALQPHWHGRDTPEAAAAVNAATTMFRNVPQTKRAAPSGPD